MALQQQVAEANHCGQQVIEVVGDAAGQLSHCLHFLGLGKLQFQIFLSGAVNQVNNEAVALFGMERMELLHGA